MCITRYSSKHAIKFTRGERLHAAAPAAIALAIAVAIFLLTEQSPETTSAESSFVNDLLVSLFGGIPGLYDPTTGLWLGIGIRHWAHVVEFGVFGLFVALAATSALRPWLLAPGAISAAICAAFSLFDQVHKLFVPGRHFDCFDLAMDALGYCLAIMLVLAFAELSGTYSVMDSKYGKRAG